VHGTRAARHNTLTPIWPTFPIPGGFCLAIPLLAPAGRLSRPRTPTTHGTQRTMWAGEKLPAKAVMIRSTRRDPCPPARAWIAARQDPRPYNMAVYRQTPACIQSYRARVTFGKSATERRPPTIKSQNAWRGCPKRAYSAQVRRLWRTGCVTGLGRCNRRRRRQRQHEAAVRWQQLAANVSSDGGDGGRAARRWPRHLALAGDVRGDCDSPLSTSPY